jgi:hypothetical protein
MRMAFAGLASASGKKEFNFVVLEEQDQTETGEPIYAPTKKFSLSADSEDKSLTAADMFCLGVELDDVPPF